MNFYVYVANNPLGFIDSFGLDKGQCPAGSSVLAGTANLSAGFGDIITSGLGATYLFGLPSGTEAIRQLWLDTPGLPTTGAPDVVNPKCSWAYTTGQVTGAADAIAIIGVGAVRGVQPGAFLNTGRYLRVGFGRHGGDRVFRIAGRWVERITGRAHIDLWRGGPL